MHEHLYDEHLYAVPAHERIDYQALYAELYEESEHYRPMTRTETAAWLLYCVCGCTLVYWIDAAPGDGLWHYAKGLGLGIVLALWVSMLKPPLRWWIAVVFSADILWIKADLLAAKFGLAIERLPDLTEIDWAVWCWCGGGFVAGWLYAVVRGWSFSLDGDDFLASTHCLFWGAFVGPVLLVGVLVAWLRQAAVEPTPSVKSQHPIEIVPARSEIKRLTKTNSVRRRL